MKLCKILFFKYLRYSATWSMERGWTINTGMGELPNLFGPNHIQKADLPKRTETRVSLIRGFYIMALCRQKPDHGMDVRPPRRCVEVTLTAPIPCQSLTKLDLRLACPMSTVRGNEQLGHQSRFMSDLVTQSLTNCTMARQRESSYSPTALL